MNTNNNETVNVQTEQTQNNEVLSWEKAAETERHFPPFVNVYETTDEFVLTANLPGVSKENVKLKLEEGSLTIFGKVDYNELLQRKYLLNETGVGNYFRKFKVSDNIDERKIEATYENGQLVVKLPKHDRIKPRTISIS